MELLYLISREEGEEAARGALRLVESFTIEWITCEPSILEAAARLKARGRLSVADSWIGATAISRQAVLIHKDPEFAKFPEIAQEVLVSKAVRKSRLSNKDTEMRKHRNLPKFSGAH